MANYSVNEVWFRVAKSFSDTDLRSHPNTDDVMSYFSDDVIFSKPGSYNNIGKNTAWAVFKLSCEWGVLEYKNITPPTFSQEDDHIVWTFDSMQTRKGILPLWIKSPHRYNIHCKVHLYFSGEGDNCKISKYVTICSEWDELDQTSDCVFNGT